MQNQFFDQLMNRNFPTQNDHYHPPNNGAQNAYIRTANTYYPPQGGSHVNGHFDHLTNAQSSCNTHALYMPTNTYQQHHHHHHNQQQDQQQSHLVNNYANQYGAGIQNMQPVTNPIVNDMSLAYNSYNIPPNQQDHATANHNTCPMDTNSDINLPNSSDIVQINTAELFDATVDIKNFADGLSSNVEAQLSIE